MKEPESRVVLPTPIVLGKDEMNLAEYPLSILTHRVPHDRKTYSFTQRITDYQGTVIKQSWRAWRGWGLCCFIQLLDVYIGIPSLEQRA